MLIIAGVDDNALLMVFLDGRVHLLGHSLLCGPLPGGCLLNLPCGSLLDGSLPSLLCWDILLDDCRLCVSTPPFCAPHHRCSRLVSWDSSALSLA